MTTGSHRPISAARAPDSCSAPLAAASATSSRPVASSSQVRGSVSTTLGGLPRRVLGSRNALHRNERWHAYLDAGARRDRGQRAGGQPHRLGELGAPRLGPAVVAQPVRDRRHGGARLRRIGAATGGHTLDSQSACRPPPTALQNGRRGVAGDRRGRRRAFIYLQFRGDLTDKTQLTLLSPRAGLVVEPGSKVTYNGVEIGRVADIDMVDVRRHAEGQTDPRRRPRYIKFIPANVVAEIQATTVFGNKYVSFSSPKYPSPQRISSHDVIDASSVTTEFNTLFETVTSIAEQVDPDQAEPDADRDRRGADGSGRSVRRLAGRTATASSTT